MYIKDTLCLCIYSIFSNSPVYFHFNLTAHMARLNELNRDPIVPFCRTNHFLETSEPSQQDTSEQNCATYNQRLSRALKFRRSFLLDLTKAQFYDDADYDPGVNGQWLLYSHPAPVVLPRWTSSVPPGS